MARKILSQTPTTASEVREALSQIKDRDKELGFRAQKTIDYLDSLKPLDTQKAKQLFDKLVKLEVPRLRDLHFYKIIDLMPTSAKDVKTILQGYNVTVTQENCKKIADTVAEFV